MCCDTGNTCHTQSVSVLCIRSVEKRRVFTCRVRTTTRSSPKNKNREQKKKTRTHIYAHKVQLWINNTHTHTRYHHEEKEKKQHTRCNHMTSYRQHKIQRHGLVLAGMINQCVSTYVRTAVLPKDINQDAREPATVAPSSSRNKERADIHGGGARAYSSSTA